MRFQQAPYRIADVVALLFILHGNTSFGSLAPIIPYRSCKRYLNKADFKNYILNPDIYPQIENVWVNQNIVLNSEELKLLEAKGFQYIPREFFGQELKEAAE